MNKLLGVGVILLAFLTFAAIASQSALTRPAEKDTSKAPVLGHIMLYVQDADASLKFYRQYLQMELQEKTTHEGETRYFLSNTSSHHQLVLIQKQGLPLAEQRVLQQIAFQVADHAGLAEAYQKLRDLEGLEIEDNRISWSLYFKDPDENKIEVYWDVRDQPFGAPKWNGQSEKLTAAALLRGKP